MYKSVIHLLCDSLLVVRFCNRYHTNELYGGEYGRNKMSKKMFQLLTMLAGPLVKSSPRWCLNYSATCWSNKLEGLPSISYRNWWPSTKNIFFPQWIFAPGLVLYIFSLDENLRVCYWLKQVRKEISPVVVTVISSLVPILTNTEVCWGC